MGDTIELSEVEKIDSLDQKQFLENFYKPFKPLVIKGLSNKWAALQKWSPDFFKEQHGEKLVKVYDASFVSAGKNYMSNAETIPLREYIDKVMTTSQDLRMFLYNIKAETPELVDDIVFPSLIDNVSKSFVFMFFGCKNSVTQMHFDIDMSHVFHTVIKGKRTVYLFPIEQSKNLHRYPFTCRSYVDVEKPDVQKFPNLKEAKGYKVELNAGDTLYMPSGYWHHFIYDEAGYSISLRCPSQTVLGKLQGAYNLLVMQSIDRLLNKLSPKLWFNWKEQQALKAN